jgi:methionyl-tRNA formyltransferase
MGTPGFAASALQALIESEHEIARVFTKPDKPKGRGNKIMFSPVKELALKHGFPVFQPVSLKNPEDIETVKAIKPDCIVVAAYGLILPEEILELNCINIHASLLPKYRGAAPINRVIMNGETETGITVMKMAQGIDTGDMLLSEKVSIDNEMTASVLHDILAETGAKLIIKTLELLEKGGLTPVKQDASISSYAHMLKKEECRIDFSKPATEVCNFIRGLADSPCAYTFLGVQRIKIYKALRQESKFKIQDLGIQDSEPGKPFPAGKACLPGKIVDGSEFIVACGNHSFIKITELQPEGGRRMKTEEFLKGINRNNINNIILK